MVLRAIARVTCESHPRACSTSLSKVIFPFSLCRNPSSYVDTHTKKGRQEHIEEQTFFEISFAQSLMRKAKRLTLAWAPAQAHPSLQLQHRTLVQWDGRLGSDFQRQVVRRGGFLSVHQIVGRRMLKRHHVTSST